MPRTLDAVLKHDELLALLGSGDARGLYDAARAAMVALEFRATDAMLGLTPVNADVVARLAEAVRAALREAAGLGLHEAACELGRLLSADGDPDAAFAAVADAAEAGHGPSAVLAARIAGRPWGQARHAQALRWLSAAREPDADGRVHFMLGLYASLGFGAAQDYGRARTYYEEAAARGDADAMFELYVMHARGIGCPEDQELALAWCRRGAEAGNLRAMGNLGGFYATGSGVERDPALALAWYERAAQAGHGRSAATLGTMYATGDCVPRSPARAREWFRAAEALDFDWREMAEAVELDPDEWEADAEAAPSEG
ncbi:tetratricopeptide repeat protein [Nannocystis pusilla]|uniref:tetratricopeptide repeat protein n=1 Tax=Nannocystis pusilla TaxID=889268 RepID=UPI003DA37207